VLVGVGWADVCTKFHRVNPESCAHCVESDIELSAGVPAGEFKLYHCKNHMWDVATPIMVGGKHIGNLFSGQFFFEGEALDYELFRAQARQYGFEETAYMAALERVKRLKRDTLTTGMKYLTRLADLISKLSYTNLKLARSLAERERAEQALIRSEKLVSVGRLAATIAHEINNPLEAVTNLLYLLASDTSLPGPSREMAELADREVQRAAQIARRTLGFYRERNARMEVGISEMFRDLTCLYQLQMKYKNVRLQVRCADEDATVIGNSGELRQLFSNLLANAIDAVPECGSVHIRVGRQTSLVRGRPTVRITVADTGPGIEHENLKRIFEPFFTTKKDVGTGLGLWISEEIVKKHGGTMRVRSRVGHGTVFCVRLPAVAALAVHSGV
jgi:polar amino acid transport system substrate-binding protein